MPTIIHISSKLEKLVSKHVEVKEYESDCILGKWNATVFNVNRKKCLLVVNAKTNFSIMIPNVKMKELSSITELLCENFYSQLVYGGIFMNYDILCRWIGDIKFSRTNNDSKTIGVLNYNIGKIKDWKYEFYGLDSFDFREITKRMNSIPFKNLNWKTPNEKMIKLINTSA